MKKVLVLASGVIGFFIFIIVPFFVIPSLIHVHIECLSQFGVCPSSVRSSLAPFDKKSLRVAKAGIGKVLKASFLVSDYSLQFKLPNSLLVNIIARKPNFSLEYANGKFALIDFSGKILTLSDSTDLPFIVVNENPGNVGDNVSGQDLFALQLISGVNEMYQVKNGKIDNGTLLVELPVGVEVIFPLQGDAEVLMGSLRLVYSNIESPDNTKHYSQIDLRFRNVILR